MNAISVSGSMSVAQEPPKLNNQSFLESFIAELPTKSPKKSRTVKIPKKTIPTKSPTKIRTKSPKKSPTKSPKKLGKRRTATDEEQLESGQHGQPGQPMAAAKKVKHSPSKLPIGIKKRGRELQESLGKHGPDLDTSISSALAPQQWYRQWYHRQQKGQQEGKGQRRQKIRKKGHLIQDLFGSKDDTPKGKDDTLNVAISSDSQVDTQQQHGRRGDDCQLTTTPSLRTPFMPLAKYQLSPGLFKGLRVLRNSSDLPDMMKLFDPRNESETMQVPSDTLSVFRNVYRSLASSGQRLQPDDVIKDFLSNENWRYAFHIT